MMQGYLVSKNNGNDRALVAEDPSTRAVFEMAGRAAASDATVLITGPSGCGKEVVARYVHDRSARAAGPFVAINCAAIPGAMLEATLFGYERGAFTGASRSLAGKFEQAQGGTLLLDEISEMDGDLQAKLLRVLQERVVERLGSRQQIKLDLRVLATSNRDLPSEVSARRFREDLFFRLSVVPIRIPPLALRPKDILPLARAALARLTADGSFSAAAEQVLSEHPWPGNARELENVVQRACIFASSGSIEPWHLQFDHLPSFRGAVEPRLDTTDVSARGGLRACLQDEEQQQVLDAIHCAGSRRGAAGMLGISERTLRYKLARLRLQGVRLPEARRA